MDSESGKAKFFALADFGVGSGEKFHGHKIASEPALASLFLRIFRKKVSRKKLDKKKKEKKLDSVTR
jgi:hypothetical protein